MILLLIKFIQGSREIKVHKSGAYSSFLQGENWIIRYRKRMQLGKHPPNSQNDQTAPKIYGVWACVGSIYLWPRCFQNYCARALSSENALITNIFIPASCGDTHVMGPWRRCPAAGRRWTSRSWTGSGHTDCGVNWRTAPALSSSCWPYPAWPTWRRCPTCSPTRRTPSTQTTYGNSLWVPRAERQHTDTVCENPEQSDNIRTHFVSSEGGGRKTGVWVD